MNKTRVTIFSWLVGVLLFGGSYTGFAFFMAYVLDIEVAISGFMVLVTLAFGSLLGTAVDVLVESVRS